jgi:hypothetical protein
LAEVFAPECRHESQTRFDAIEGREDVAAYFLSWVDRPMPLAFAELALDPQGGEPCVLMSVRDSTYGRPGLGEVRSYITFQVNADGLIAGSFAVSLTPEPRACRRSGIYPGLSEDDLHYERERVGDQLSRTEGLELVLFVLPELESQVDAYLSTTTDVAQSLGLPNPTVEHIRPGDERASRLGVVAHPTVVLALDGQRVRLLEGVRAAEDLRAKLSAALASPEESESGKPLTLADIENEVEGEGGTIADFEIDEDRWGSGAVQEEPERQRSGSS